MKKALKISPNYVLAHIALVTLYSYAGREDEARAAAARAPAPRPQFLS